MEEYYETGYLIHELAAKAKIIYQSTNAHVEDKRLLLSYIFSNLTLQAGKITPRYTLGFEFLHNWMPRLNEDFESKIPLYFNVQSPFWVKTKVLSSYRDDFRTFKWNEIFEDSDLELKDMTQLLALA
ncbi:MAG: hypothetical protein IIA45_03130 [Bacteroidetes bacterium]|nr:hypothetical protein [Bacteroidota bacterium]